MTEYMSVRFSMIRSPDPVLGVDVPDGVDDNAGATAGGTSVMPWFRGNWATGGSLAVPGVERILNNPRFLEAAKAAFGVEIVRPKTIVANLTTPMPAGAPHVDIPSFRGATREHYPLRFLAAMGESRLFERRPRHRGRRDLMVLRWTWRRIRLPAGRPRRDDVYGEAALCERRDRRRQRSHVPPYRRSRRARCGTTSNRTDCADSRPDRGDWAIVDNGRTVATYRAGEVRLSVLWKAEVFADHEAEKKAISDRLSLDRVMEILTNDLRRRGIEYVEPSDPLKSDAWVETLRRTYYTSPGGGRLYDVR